MAQLHYSVSLSVYSPVETERRSTFPLRDPIEEENEDDIDESSELFGSDFNDTESQTSASPSRVRQESAILPETSSQTFKSYYTAINGSEPSFSSINNSLLRQESNEQGVSEMPGSFDPDETPRLNTEMHGQNDAIFDQTPVLNANGFNDEIHPTSEQAAPATSKVAQLQVPHKFKRLSVTLLQTGTNVSRESHLFHENFSSKAQKALSENQGRTSRTSLLYKRLHEKHDLVDPPSAAANDEDTSILSTSSNLSSAPMKNDTLYDHNVLQDEVPPRGDLPPGTQFTKPAGGLNILYDESSANSSRHDVSSENLNR